MENPQYTFLTPTTISGDRQNVDVVAHELCHSWSGNLVSLASWEVRQDFGTKPYPIQFQLTLVFTSILG